MSITLRLDAIVHQNQAPNELYAQFQDASTDWVIEPQHARFSSKEIDLLKQIAKRALVDTELDKSSLIALQRRFHLLAAQDYRLQETSDDLQRLTLDPSPFWPTAYIPFAKTIIQLARRIKNWFLLYLKTHNHAWNYQKYDVALDELKKALSKKYDLTALLQTLKEPKTPLEMHTSQVIESLCYPEYYSDARSRYTQLLLHLRSGLEHKGSQFLTDVATCRLCDVNMHVFGESLVENMIAAGLNTVSARTTWLEVLPIAVQFQAMQKARRNLSTYLKIQFNKVKATINCDFDPHFQTNVPHKQLDFTLDSTSEPIRMIAMGTPTIQKTVGPTAINPEFKAFIEGLGSERHLYINLQNRQARWFFCDESSRVDALEAFSEQSRGKLHLITLAQDSAFYHQTGHFKKPQRVDAFIDEFIHLMKEGKEGYHFGSVQDSAFWQRLQNELTTYVRALFEKNDADILNDQEKKNCIELCYPVIIHNLIEHVRAKTMQIVCKDGIDRAGKCQGLFIQYLAAGETSGLTSERKKLLAAISLARAPIVKAQPMVAGRRARFLSALAYLEDIACQARVRAQFWNHKMRPTIIAPVREESQRAIDS